MLIYWPGLLHSCATDAGMSAKIKVALSCGDKMVKKMAIVYKY